MNLTLGGLPALVFDVPWLLLAGVVLPLLVWILRRAQHRQRQSRLARFAEASALSRLLSLATVGTRARTVRLVAIAVLSGLAFSGPRWGLARGPTTARGIDMALALDASLSMTAPDDRPSRLERMKQEVRRLRAMSRADRVALIAFAGRSYILTPLTADDGALELFLENLDPSVVGQGGSSLARAIRQGTELLLASDGSADRALVVMSDGEAFEPVEDVEAAAAEAGRQGVRLVTVGFGTTQGSTIPIRDGTVVREKRDDDGNIVVTRYEPTFLAAAATAAGGTFIPAEVSDKATRIRGALRSLRSAQRTFDSREDHVARFLWLLVPALALLVLDTWLLTRSAREPRTKRDGPGETAGNAVIALWLLIVPVLGACDRPPDPAVLFAEGNVAGAIAGYRAQIADGDTTARTRYNLGTALLGADSLKEGADLLDAVRREADGELGARARFNTGYAALRLGRIAGAPDADEQLATARAIYRGMLRERPLYGDAKWNYELALRNQPPSGGGGGGGGGGDQQDEQPQDQPQDEGGLDQKQAEALLNSAAREERDVQGRKQRQGRTPPGGKDW